MKELVSGQHAVQARDPLLTHGGGLAATVHLRCGDDVTEIAHVSINWKVGDNRQSREDDVCAKGGD